MIITNHNVGEGREKKLFLASEINSEGMWKWESEHLKAQKAIEKTSFFRPGQFLLFLKSWKEFPCQNVPYQAF